MKSGRAGEINAGFERKNFHSYSFVVLITAMSTGAFFLLCFIASRTIWAGPKHQGIPTSTDLMLLSDGRIEDVDCLLGAS